MPAAVPRTRPRPPHADRFDPAAPDQRQRLETCERMDPEAYLRSLGVDPTDPAALMTVLDREAAACGGNRPGAGSVPEEIARLITSLGDPSWEERERAMARLREIGASALDPLRAAAGSPDPEVAHRVSVLLSTLTYVETSGAFPMVVEHLLRRHARGEPISTDDRNRIAHALVTVACCESAADGSRSAALTALGNASGVFAPDLEDAPPLLACWLRSREAPPARPDAPLAIAVAVATAIDASLLRAADAPSDARTALARAIAEAAPSVRTLPETSLNTFPADARHALSPVLLREWMTALAGTTPPEDRSEWPAWAAGRFQGEEPGEPPPQNFR